MNSDCNNRNPLQRSGVNQYQRVLAALMPNHVQVDERDYADLILFAKNYAKQLKYFNVNNVHDGDWSVFMSMDVSVTLASLMKLNVKGAFDYVKNIFDKISTTEVSDVTALQNHFKVLFDFTFSVTTLLDDYYKSLPSDFEFKSVLGNAIHSKLPAYFDRIRKYYDEAVVQSVIDPTGSFVYEPTPFEIILSQDFDATALTELWTDSSVPAFTAILNGTSTALKIKNTSTHNLFTGIFDQYLKTLASIVNTSSSYLDQTLSSFPTHSPHYALFLTFIKLFRIAQDSLNGFTARHLDLYYKEILQLTHKEAEPDTVHLTFELAKPANNAVIKKGTVFKAGKDTDGAEIFYEAAEEVVLNKGTVKSLKNIFSFKDGATDTRQIFAGPVADSEDGFGATLESTDKSWKTFGSADRQAATIGFIIASNYLYLKEGTRKITFKFYADEGSPVPFENADINTLFSLQLSGEKEWIDVSIQSSDVSVDPSKDFFAISVTLDGGVPAIIPYTEKVHELNLNTELPVAKFIVNAASAKDDVWNFSFQKVGIDVEVTGVRDIVIQNDAGTLNPSKPFDLFGTSPHVGSAFIIGSKELFAKTVQPSGNVGVTLTLTWDDHAELTDKITVSENQYTVDIYYLEDAAWKQSAPGVKLFTDNGSSLNDSSSLEATLPSIDVTPDYTANEEYSVRSTVGFLKLALADPEFGHSTYAEDVLNAAKNATITSSTATNGTVTTNISMAAVEEPYTPRVKEISLNYSASTVIDFSSNEEARYFHLTPFGYKDISNDEAKGLLPEFTNEGELYVGIDNFTTGQTLTTLFQVAEGTADPLTTKQEVIWYYLETGNKWTEFAKGDVTDGTNDLTQSGIIRFVISDQASAENTLMTEQLYWLRAVVVEKTNAVCKLIDVVAQAVEATFYDYKNTGLVFKANIPANTISKAVVSDASVKKIVQPYSSTGGRRKETDDHFYVRVSERLRHKNRGISMWDFERLVLEAFPDIYKVKCINHTQVSEKSISGQVVYIDNETKPGGVLMVAIPNLQNKNAYDPLRPYTSLGVLAEIKKFLYQHISPHVMLDVRNPRFEEIQLEFSVKFVIDENEFYAKQLKEELEQFLAPWAYDPESDIEFGGKISKSVLINFIEERSYVDYLSCVKMYQIVEGKKSSDVEEAIATSARSVFVSVKSDDSLYAHKIEFLNTADCLC